MNNQQNDFENSNIQETESDLTTDDLVLMIGEREVNSFQNRKIINNLKNKLTDIYKINQALTSELEKVKNDLNKDKESKETLQLKEENRKLKHDHKLVINKLNKKIENLRTQLKKEEFEEETKEKEDGGNFEEIVDLE